jgi:lipopolysaccharide/colanic/teichoic acid biosynthesis glycosyltransferase
MTLPNAADQLKSASVSTSRGARSRAEVPKAVERPRSVETPAYRATPGSVPEVFPRERHEGFSRALNVAAAGLGLVLALPILLIAAILIKLTTRGPILYSQTRVGMDRRWRETLALKERRNDDLGGQVYTIFKLRTMRVDAERFSGAVWAQENDPRVTRLGRFLRKYRVDEIPQLWNVLRGDMNIVGPRPERPSIAARLRRDIPEYRFRNRVKPGLTGLAQINQRYDACLEDVRMKVKWDIAYIERQSLWTDILIMLRTVPSILLKFQGW